MGISELLVQLADPQAIKSLSFMEKMAGGLIVTFLGMGITFIALILLQLLIDLQAKIINKPKKKPLEDPVAIADQSVDHKACDSKNEEELIAVISAAVAMKLQRSTGDIVIHNIRKIEEPSPSWSRAGILDQMNMRL